MTEDDVQNSDATTINEVSFKKTLCNRLLRNLFFIGIPPCKFCYRKEK